jgi:excisionase family DNA binding protein
MFKEMDPETEITEYTLRKMISEGTIPYIKTGNKFLINVDLLIKMFYGENTEAK